MRLTRSFPGFLALLLGPALIVHAESVAAQLVVAVENPIALERPDETIAIAWSTLVQRLPSASADRVRVIDAGTGAELLSQVLDANADGAADSLLFVAPFRAGEARRFVVEAAPPSAQQVARVFAMHDDYRDDVAWESDRIGYRMYGQGLWQASEFQPLVSSGVDVWPKRVRDLIVRRWHDKGHDAYHVDTGEGADFYTVGPTLGAAGTAIWRSETMHRAKNFKSHRMIANGPVRAIFELQYEPWDAAGVEVTEVKRISIDAGQNLFRQEITYQAAPNEIPFVVGTVKRAGLVGATSRAHEWAWLSTWGPVERQNGGHGSLGTGMLVPNDNVLEMRESGDHYFVVSRAQAGTPAVLYSGAGWTASGDFASVEDWWAYLDAFAERLANPLRITIEDSSSR